MSPVRLFVICISVRFVMLFFETFVLSFSIDYKTVIYLSCLFLIVYLGHKSGNLVYNNAYFSRRINARRVSRKTTEGWDYSFNINVIIFFALLFSVLYALDAFFIKRINLEQGLAIARTELSQTSRSLKEAFSRAFMFSLGGFGAIAGAIAVFLNTQLTNKKKALLWFCYTIPIALTLLTGVRNFSVFSIFLVIFVYFSDPYRKTRTLSTKIVYGFFVGSVLFVILLIFQQRALFNKQLTIYDTIFDVSNNMGYHVLKFLLEENFPEFLMWLFVTPVMLYDYLSQGVYVLNSIITAPKIPGPYFGAYSFNPIFRIFTKLGFGVVAAEDIHFDLSLSGIRVGSYSTLFGVSILDFGIVGSLLFILILVMISQFVYRSMQSNNRDRRFTSFHLLNSYFCLLFFVSFLYSIFDISIGLFIPLDIFILYFISNFHVMFGHSAVKNNLGWCRGNATTI